MARVFDTLNKIVKINKVYYKSFGTHTSHKLPIRVCVSYQQQVKFELTETELALKNK